MSIVINGVSMPKDGECVVIFPGGVVQKYKAGGIAFFEYQERTEEAVAVQLPPHGRLGDLDSLMAEFEQMQTLLERRGHEFACSFMSSSMEISTEWYCVEDAVNAAPTIIPAEGGADG